MNILTTRSSKKRIKLQPLSEPAACFSEVTSLYSNRPPAKADMSFASR